MLIIGHRGARGLAPENTMAAIAKGLEYHADEIEIDIRVTRDFIPILHHNAEVTVDTGRHKVITSTYRELLDLKPDLVTLTEALELVTPKARLLIEVKPGEPVDPVIDVIREFIGKDKRKQRSILLGSKSQITLLDLHRALPDIEKVVIESWSGVRAHFRAKAIGTKRLNMRSWWLWKGFLKSMQRHGYLIAPYTMNSPSKVHKWQPYLYGVVTDYPDRFESE